jgi:predicted outer membrane repeat protein
MQPIVKSRTKVPFLIKSLAALIFCLTTPAAFSQSITVTATADVVDGNTSSISALAGTPGADGLISLREAILAANGEPTGATVTIILPGVTLILSIPGTGETASAPNASIGDLDVLAPATGTKTVHIIGAGSASSVISQTTGTDRIFDVHPNNTPGGGNITFSISGASLTGGVASAPVSGGALLAGRPNDAIIIADCIFHLNTASSNGGAISQSSAAATHNLTITNTTFSNNTASTASGGAINYAGRGTVSITGCTFSGNSAGTLGGAINVTGTAPGPGTANILRNSFTGNIANGATFGGASVAVVNAVAININFNRIIGNTATVAAGKNISTGGGSVGSMNTNNNWWGINSGPAASDVLGTAAANWLQLKTVVLPATICNTATGPGNTSTVTASFLSNSANAAIAPADLSALVGLPVTWTATLGTLGAPQELTIQTDGEAINTFTSNGTGGTATVSAQADNVSAGDALAGKNINVNISSAAPTGVTGITSVCSGGSTTLTVDGGIKGTGAVTEWFTGSCEGTAAGTGDAITVSPTTTTTYYVRYRGDCNTTDCAAVTVTVSTSSTAPTGATGITSICSGGSTTLTVDGGIKGTGAVTEWFTGSCGGTLIGTGDAITVSPTSTTTYYIRYNGDCNATSCATVTVTVNTISVAPGGVTGNTTICYGNSTTLTVEGGLKGTGAVTEWFTGSCGGTLIGTGDAITVSPASTTTYYVRYNGTCNTTSCAVVTVTVSALSTAPTGATGTTSVCSGGSTTLTVAGGFKGSGAVTEWFTGSCGGTLIGTGDAITVSPGSTTTYYVRYSGGCNTTSCAAVTVTVFNSVMAACTTNNPSMYFGYAADQSATITATATGGSAPYTVSITMNRSLNCNIITSSGDELWTGVGGTSVNNVCPASGTGLIPVSTGIVPVPGGSYSVNVTLMQDAIFTATITDANGCVSTCTISVHAEDARCFSGNSGNEKVKICHQTGNGGCHEICVNANAVDAHLAHGDFAGDCLANCESPVYSRTPLDNTEKRVKPAGDIQQFEVKAIPNPSEDQFTLVVENGGSEKISVIVYDAVGRIVKQIEKSEVSGQIRLGTGFKAGTYVAVVRQGNNVKILRLLKL